MSLESIFSKIGRSLDSFFQKCSGLVDSMFSRKGGGEPSLKDGHSISASYSILFFDSFIAFLSIFVSIHLRIGADFLDYSPMYIVKNMFVYGLVSASVFTWLQTYQSFWRYTSVEDAVPVFLSVVISNMLFFPLMMLMNQDDFLPYSVLIINVFVLFLMLIIPRVTTKILYNNRMNKMKKIEAAGGQDSEQAQTISQAILIGSPASIDMFLRDVISNDDIQFNIDPVAILSLNNSDIGRSIKGVPIMGSVRQLGLVLRELSKETIAPQQIIIVERNISDDMRDFLVSYVQEHGILLMHMFYQYSLSQVIRMPAVNDQV